MATSQKYQKAPPHFALLPSAGMGHLAPFCHLAGVLSDRGCDVSFITPQPTVSSAESLRISRLLASFPTIKPLSFPLADLDPSLFPPNSDPFYLRYESIRRSSHLLAPLLGSSRFSAIIIDIGLASAFVPLANELRISSFIFFSSSASMLSLYAHLPAYFSTRSNSGIGDIEIPGLWTIPSSSVLPGLDDEENFLTQQILANGRIFPRADGILINTFEAIESRALAALNAGRVAPGLPPVLAIGPLRTPPICTRENDAAVKKNDGSIVFGWLDSQPKQSVLYVSFGSRTAMSKEQIKQLAIGLEKSQCRFLWIIKTKKVDREEREVEAGSLLGEGYVERVKEKGLVIINGWVEQEEVLRHGSIGGFLSHCGWNSVLEAWAAGVRVIAWPRGADQRVNGEVVRRCRAGVWMEEWRWEVEEGVVEGEQIGEGVKEAMEDEGLKEKAGRVREDGLKAVEAGGTSDEALGEFIGRFKG